MESPFLPSEIARLVLGYLEEEKCDEAAQCFLEHSPHLSECLAVARQGRKFSTRVLGNSLNDILDEYCAVNSLVAEHLRKLPEDSAEQLRQCGRTIDQLRFLLDSTRSGQTVLVSITVPPQGGSPPGSNVSSIVSNRSRSWLQSSSERKRTSVRWHQDTKQRSRDRDDRGSSAGSIPPLEATPLESLPGISGGSSGLDSRSTQTGSEGESQASSAAKALEETTVSSSGPASECVAERQANTSDSDQSYKAPKVPSKDSDHPSPTVHSPRRKSHSSKKKPTTPLLKGQSPNRPRRSHSEDSDSSENVAKSLHRALLDNKELHEKIAENINRVIRIPNESGTEAQVLGLQASEPLADCDGMLHELNQAIKTIVEQTEQDPLFERFLEEIIGPAEDEGSPSPAAAESETEDASGLSETVADEDVQSKSPRRVRQEEEDEQNVKSPSSEVPLKQRLRSSSKQKRDSLNTSGNSPLSNKETKKPVCSLDDQNAAAIQYIVDALPHHNPDGTRQPSPHRSKGSALPHHAPDGARQLSPHRSKGCVAPQTVNSSTENTSAVSSRNNSDVIREKRTPSQCVSTTSELNSSATRTVSEESAKVDSCVSDKRTDDLGGNMAFMSGSLGKPLSLDAVTAKKPADNPPAVLISTEMPMVLPVQSSEPKSSMPVVMVTIPSSQELCSVSTTLEASHHRQHLTEQDIMSMPTVIVCDPDRGMAPFFNLTQQSLCTTAEVTHIQSCDDITSRYKPIAPKMTTSTNTSTTVTSLPTDIVQPIVLRSVSHKQLETILTTTCTTPLIVKRDITPRIKTAVPSKTGGPLSPSKVRKVVEVQTKSVSTNNSKTVVDLSKPSTSKEGFGAEQYKRTLKQQTGGESRKKKEDPKKDVALSGVRTRSQDKVLNKPLAESPTGPDSITLYACDADGKNDKMSTLKRQDVDLPNVCTDGSPFQLSKSPATAGEGTPSEDGREKLLGALNLKHSGRKSSENIEDKCSKVVSPQLKTLLDMSKNNIEKAAVFEDMELEKSRDTPQTLSERSISNPKRLSLSTPRRRRSHIRALDFGTPPKSGTERSALRRSNTSPKGVAGKQRSPRGNDSACKSVRRSSCYKSPLSRINQAKNIRSSLFKSPNPPCGSDVQDAAVVTSTRAECPIATRSPAPQLKGDWDKVTGAGLIFGSETPDDFTSEPASVKQLVPKTLFFSPESQPSDSETQQQPDTAASVVTDKGDSTDSASVTSSSQMTTKPKSKSRTWDSDLRALLSKDFDNLEVVPKPTKVKARKRCSGNSEIKVPAKKNKKSRVSKATKDEARMVEAMLNSSGETEKGHDNSDVTSPAKDTSEISRAEAKETFADSSSQKDDGESIVSNVESTSDPSCKTSSSVEEAAPSHEPPVEEPSPDSSSACDSNVAVTSSEKMFSNSAACAKVVLSPTKLNASKRTFVQKPKGCGLFVSEDFEENIETFVISGDSPTDTAQSKPSNEVPENTCAKSEVSLPPPPPKTVLLDTPMKIDAIAADLSCLIPLTPRLLSPRHNQEDTPMTKFLRDQPCINLSMIQTPSFPPTPHMAVTPDSQKSDESPSSYATRMTDYSSCSSYYNPSTYLNTPAKQLEQVLIDECHRIEMGKPSSKEKRRKVESSAEKQVVVDTTEIEKEMERIHGPTAEMTCVEKEMEPTCEVHGHLAKTTLVEGMTDKGSKVELSYVERELDGIVESKQRSTEIRKGKDHEAMLTHVAKELERIHKDKGHEVETTHVEKELEHIHKDEEREVETTHVEKELELIHKDEEREVETTHVEKELELIHKDEEREVEITHVEKELELIHKDKEREVETTHVEKELELIHKDRGPEVEATLVEKELEHIHKDKEREVETTHVEKELELIHKGRGPEVEATLVEKELEHIHKDKEREVETTHVEKELELIHKDRGPEVETTLVEKELEHIHKDRGPEVETTHVEKELELIHKEKEHDVKTTHVEKKLEKIFKDKGREAKTKDVSKELEQFRKRKRRTTKITNVEKRLEQIHKDRAHAVEATHIEEESGQIDRVKGREAKTTNVEKELEQIRKDRAHTVEATHIEEESGQIHKVKEHEAKTTNVEKELEQIHNDKEPVPDITLVEKELERIHEGKVSCIEIETERIRKEGKMLAPSAELPEPRPLDDIDKPSAETSVCSGMESRPVGKEVLEAQRPDLSEHQGHMESNTKLDAGGKVPKLKISLHSEKVAVQSSDTVLEQAKSGANVPSVQKKGVKDIRKRLKPCDNKELRTPVKSKNKIVKKSADNSVKKQELEKEIMQKSSEELIKNCLENAHKMLFSPSKEDWDGSDSSSDSSSSSSSTSSGSSSSSSDSHDSSSSEDFSPVGLKKKVPKIIESDSQEEPLSAATAIESSEVTTEVTSGIEQQEKSNESSSLAPENLAAVVTEQSKRPTTLTVVVDLKKAGIREEVICSSKSSWEVTQDKSKDSSVTAAGEVQNCAVTSNVTKIDSNAEEISSSLKNMEPSTQWNLCADDVGNLKARVCRASFDKTLTSELEDKRQRMLARLKEADKKMKPVKSKGSCPPKSMSSVRKKSDDVGDGDDSSKKMTSPNIQRTPSSQTRRQDVLNQTSAEGIVSLSLQSVKSPKKDVEAIAARLLQQKNAASSRVMPRKESTVVTTEESGGRKEKPNEAGGLESTEMCARDKVKLIHNASCIRPPMLKTCREKPIERKGSTSRSEPPPAAVKVKKKKSSSISPQAKSLSPKRPIDLLDSEAIAKQLIEERDVSEEVYVEKLEEPALSMSQGMFVVRYAGLGPHHPDFVVEDISGYVMDSEEGEIPTLRVSPLQELLTVAPSEKKPVTDKPKSPKKKTASPVKNIRFDTRPLSVRRQEMYRSLRNRHRNSLERKLGSPSSRSSIHCKQKTSLQHTSPLAHLYKDYISEKYTVTRRKHSRFSPARHKHSRSSREELNRSPRRLKTQEPRRRASSRTREPSSSRRTRHDIKRKLSTRHSGRSDSSPTSRSKKTSERSPNDHSRRKEGELSDTSDEKEHPKKKPVSRVRNPNNATEPEQELTDDTLMTYAIVGSYREETTGESSSVGSPYHTPGQDFDITARLKIAQGGPPDEAGKQKRARRGLRRDGCRRTGIDEERAHLFEDGRVPPPSVSCLLNQEASDTSAAASGPMTSDESRSLPPKKRKASTEDSTVQPEKRARAENPQSLLKSVDLDIFLTMVHGNELS